MAQPNTEQEQMSSQDLNSSTANIDIEGSAAKRRKITPLVVILAVVLIACIVVGVAGGLYLINTYSQIHDVENSQAMVPSLPNEIKDGEKNPVDFASLEKQNSDIYAWLYIPGTTINFPICQSAEDDSYYLNHTADRKESELGAIFSESQFNNLDFQDRVTILYGHNGFGNTMFTDLHEFEKGDFFNAWDKVYVYTQGHIYTYRIVSAFMSDERHLMGSYNFQSDVGYSQFLTDISKPKAIGANVRDADLNANSKILVLSTCNTGVLDASGRYVVCGVMIDDRQTD